ncbi:ATP-dependent RNA helicase dbp6 [Pseudocyphellaria aurata]|nr:ATP-dependent RNA helicase dbp6 [Pseudocyphellaria aurata]
MANPFYARYIPPPITTTKKAFDHSTDHVRAIKKRKTELGFRPLIGSNEEPEISVDIDDSVPGTSRVKLPEAKHGKKKKGGTENNSTSDIPLHLALSEGVPNENNLPSDSVLENKIAAIAVENISVKEKKKNRKKEKEKNSVSRAENGADDNNSLLQNCLISDETKHKKIRTKYEKAAVDSAQKLESFGGPKIDDFEEHEREPENPIEIHGLVPLPQPSQTLDTEDNLTFSASPDWLAHPIVVSSSAVIPLDSLNVSSSTLTALKQKGYQDAFAIQAAILPLLLPGSQQRHLGDVCISAVTGSGKTLAYALPLVENLRDKPVVRLRGLVVVPTRELVAQVRDCLEMCSTSSGLRIGTAVGSRSLEKEQELLIEKGRKYDPEVYREEMDKLSTEDKELMNWDIDDPAVDEDDSELLENYVVDYSSKVDILICTPGRLVDHIQSTKGFTLDHVQWLVIDEADRLLDESFQQWIEVVMPALEYQAPPDPRNDQLLNKLHILRQRKVQKIILSATMTKDISKLTSLKLRRPVMAVLETRGQVEETPGPSQVHLDSNNSIELPPTLKEIAIPISDTDDKPLHLIEVLRQESDFFPDSDQLREKDIESQAHSESTESSSSDSDQPSDYSSSSSSTSSSPSPSQFKSPTFKPQTPSAKPPHNDSPTYGTLIFTKDNENATRLARLLTLLRPAWQSQVGTLTKSTSSAGGRRTLAQFRARKLAIIIASDRASRGLDIPHLAHVINYDLPTSVTAYVHRVGRTARAGRPGRATTLVAKHEARWFWNEIARSTEIVRAAGGKVVRTESRLERWGASERMAYANALKRLGEETKGL